MAPLSCRGALWPFGHNAHRTPPPPLQAPQRCPYTPLPRPGVAAARRPVIMWFRNDLRLDCNDALLEANRSGSALLPVYCFDPREFRKVCGSTVVVPLYYEQKQGAAGFERTGAYRARFLLQSVADLRQRLRACGSDLLVRVGCPEDVLPALADKVNAARVFCHAEVNADEVAVESAVRDALEHQGTDLAGRWGCTLHHPEDLPFAVQRVPTSYGAFRDAMQGVRVRPAEDAPEGVLPWPATGAEGLDPGSLPTLKELGVDVREGADPHASGTALRGGTRSD